MCTCSDQYLCQRSIGDHEFVRITCVETPLVKRKRQELFDEDDGEDDDEDGDPRDSTLTFGGSFLALVVFGQCIACIYI
jgi:hypothetical protein